MTAVQADPDLLILRAAYPRGAQVPVVVRKYSRTGITRQVSFYDPTMNVDLTKEVARVLNLRLLANNCATVYSTQQTMRWLSSALHADAHALTWRTT